MSSGMARIEEICSGYIAAAEKLERERKPADGLFGMGSKPADDPCHDRFADELEKALNEIAEQAPPSSEVREILGFLYHLPEEHRQPLSIYWMLNAVHGLTLPLTELLDPQDREALSKQYGKAFPRWKRLPVQDKVYKALKKSR